MNVNKISGKSDLRDILKFMGLQPKTPIQLMRGSNVTLDEAPYECIILDEDHLDIRPLPNDSYERMKYYFSLFRNNRQPPHRADNFGKRLMVRIFDGYIKLASYYQYGLNTNINGPAIISLDGDIIYIDYLVRGHYHRFADPARIKYYNGQLVSEMYFLKGKMHNKIGPAYRWFNGLEWVNEFAINGKFVTLDKFLKAQHDN